MMASSVGIALANRLMKYSMSDQFIASAIDRKVDKQSGPP